MNSTNLAMCCTHAVCSMEIEKDILTEIPIDLKCFLEKLTSIKTNI